MELTIYTKNSILAISPPGHVKFAKCMLVTTINRTSLLFLLTMGDGRHMKFYVTFYRFLGATNPSDSINVSFIYIISLSISPNKEKYLLIFNYDCKIVFFFCNLQSTYTQ